MEEQGSGNFRTGGKIRLLRIYDNQHSGNVVRVVVRRSVCGVSRRGQCAGRALLRDLDCLLSEKQRFPGVVAFNHSLGSVSVQRNHEQIHFADYRIASVCAEPHCDFIQKCRLIATGSGTSVAPPSSTKNAPSKKFKSQNCTAFPDTHSSSTSCDKSGGSPQMTRQRHAAASRSGARQRKL